MPTRGGKPPMSARRVELVHGGRGVAEREARLEAHVLGKLLRTEQLEQAEEPVGVVLERRRAQEQDVTAEARDRRDRPPAGLAGVARRAAESLCFVHDEQIDSRCHGLVGQLRALGQHLQRDHGATMHVERVEVGTEVARHVGEALRIEEREHLVVLPPELAQPLHGQRIRRDHEAAFDLPGVHEPIQDERRLDGLAEADFVGEQPAHRDRWRSPAPRRGAGAGRAGRVRRGTSPGRRLREGSGGAGCPGGSRNPRPRRDRPGRGARGARLRAPAATARGTTPCARSRAAASRPGVAPTIVVSSRVAVIRTGRPGLRSTGISASVLAASRSVVPERGNSTTSARPSSAVTRPIPSSGLKRWVR